MKIPDNETDRLAALHQLRLLDTPSEERFDRLTRLAIQLFQVPVALISLIDSDRQWFKSRQGTELQQTERKIAFCSYTILGQDILEIPDAQQDTRFRDNPLVTDTPGIRFYAGAPLFTPEGFCIGTLCLIDFEPRQLTDTQRQSLLDLAGCAQSELELRRQSLLHTDIRERRLTDVLQHLPDNIFVIDPQANILDSVHQHNLPLSLHLQPGTRLVDCLPDTIAEKFEQKLHDLLTQQHSQQLSFHLPASHARNIYFEALFEPLSPQEILLILRNTTDQENARQELKHSKQLEQIISRAQSEFIRVQNHNRAFNGVLSDLLTLTNSAFGFIAEVRHTRNGRPFLKTFAVSNIAWDQQTRRYYQERAPEGIEFHNLHTLFGAVIKTGAAVISNEPATDARSGGVPKGHPELENFLGIPIYHSNELTAVVALANCADGYNKKDVERLHPLLGTLGQLVDACRLREQREKDQWELARLSQVVSQTTNAIIITDLEGRIQWVNAGFTRLTGYESDDVIGYNPGHILQGQDSDPAVIEHMHQSLQQQQSFTADIINYRKNKTPYWVQITCNPLFDHNGTLQGFMAIESDITQQKQHEQEINASRQMLDAILNNVPIMIFAKRADNLKFEYFNRAGEILTGLSRDDVIGKGDYDFFPQEQADFFSRKDRQVLQQQQVIDIPQEPIETPLGTRVLHTRKLTLRDRHGKPEYLLGLSEDITEKLRHERIKNEFVSTVSHELRTPLTSIAGSLGLIAGGAMGSLPDKTATLIDIAYNNCQRLTCLINDLLDMDKLMTDNMRFDFQPYPLIPLIQQAIEDNQGFADQHQVTLHFAAPEDGFDPIVNVDINRLHQVFANLLSNAAKFSPANATVKLTLTPENHYAKIAVHDQGPGIPDEQQEYIFQKFFQVDSSDSRSKGGTGLGLAITRELVKRMQGDIYFNSSAGHGTTFFIELPLVETPDYPANASVPEMPHT